MLPGLPFLYFCSNCPISMVHLNKSYLYFSSHFTFPTTLNVLFLSALSLSFSIPHFMLLNSLETLIKTVIMRYPDSCQLNAVDHLLGPHICICCWLSCMCVTYQVMSVSIFNVLLAMQIVWVICMFHCK